MKRIAIFLLIILSLFPLMAAKKTLNYYSVQNDNKVIPINLNWTITKKKDSSIGYESDLAKALLVLSRSIYVSEEVFIENSKKLGFSKIFYHDSKNDISQPVVGFAHQKHWGTNYYLIVVRGTSSFDDFLTDLKSQIDYFEEASSFVHDEFILYLNNNLKKSEEKAKKEKNVFFITGHSLGGAVSNLLSKSIEEFADRSKIFTYTFESTSTGISEEERTSTNAINIINENDFIPTIPHPEGRYGKDISFYPDMLDSLIYKEISGKERDELNDFSLSDKWSNHLLDCTLSYVLSRELREERVKKE